MCPRTEKLRLFLLGLGVGLLLSFLVGTWLWKADRTCTFDGLLLKKPAYPCPCARIYF